MKSLKEKALLSVLGVIGLYALAVGLWFMMQEAAWKKADKTYKAACKTYDDECRLISEKKKWADAYEAEKAAMPMFEEGKATGTTWQRKLDEIAKKHHISISQWQAGEEVQAGEVYELPLEVKNWEGALVSLVGFMHELENSEDGMFDIRALNIKPISNKRGYLKGSFTVTCAYMRDK